MRAIMDLNKIPQLHKLALVRIYKEYLSACQKHPPFQNPHGGYAKIKEELEETWDMIKATNLPDSSENREAMKSEVVAVGATAMRFMIDL